VEDKLTDPRTHPRTQETPEPRELTARQARFAFEYALCGNATKAAMAAGYSARSAHDTGSHLLKNPDVSRAVSAHQRKFQQETLEQFLALRPLAVDRLRGILSSSDASEPAVLAACREVLKGLEVERTFDRGPSLPDLIRAVRERQRARESTFVEHHD